MKKKAKHRHCRCVTCSNLKTERLGAYANGAAIDDWEQRFNLHEEEVRQWHTFEEYLKSLGVSNPDNNVVLCYDDTQSIGVPRCTNRPLKNFGHERFNVVPWCVINYSDSLSKDYIYSPKWTATKGSNRLISMLHLCLRRIKSNYDKPSHKARTLWLIADSASDNKNNELFAYCHLLVDAGWFDVVHLVYGPVGHTHNGVDSNHAVHNNTVGGFFSGDLGHFVSHFWKAWATNPPKASYLEKILDWKSFLSATLSPAAEDIDAGNMYGGLAGWCKSSLNERAVRGFRVGRNADKTIELTWKVDPALEKEWRGRDGTPGSRGFCMIKSTPEGLPSFEENEELTEKKEKLLKQMAQPRFVCPLFFSF